MISKLSCVFAVGLIATTDVAPVQAQYYAGTRNSEQGTVGDIDGSKLRGANNRSFGLRYGPQALFVDSETFYLPSAPDPFIFSLPNYSGAGLSFSNMTYPKYLNLIANSYDLPDEAAYRAYFAAQNEFTFTNGIPLFYGFQELSAKYSQLQQLQLQYGDISGADIFNALNPDDDASTLFSDLNDEAFDRLHQPDFVAGGGYLPFTSGPITPNTDPVDPPEFEPFPTDDPVATDDSADPPADTSAATLLEGADVLTDDELADALDILNQTSDSQEAADSAPVVSVVPEPATLGLLVAGATALVGRRRR